MIKNVRFFGRSLTILSLTLIFLTGCSSSQPQCQNKDVASRQTYTLGAGDMLGNQIVANHPTTIAKRNENLSLAYSDGSNEL